MKLNQKPLVLFTAFLAVLALLLSAGPLAGRIVLGVFWTLLLVLSAVAMWQGSGRGYGQISVLPGRIRRWVLGEMGKNRNHPINKK
jgi:hypothetical protein